MKRLDYVIESFKIVEMILVNIQNDGNIWRKIKEGVNELAGLAHDRVAVPDSAVGVDKRELSADDSRRVLISHDEDLREHGGHRCFAVSSANADAV